MNQPKYIYNKHHKIYNFKDLDGTMSEDFAQAYNYKNGFAVVQKNIDSPEQVRDLLGRITDKPTTIGKQFYEFLERERDLDDINAIFFTDDLFVQKIKEEIIRRVKRAVYEAHNEGNRISKEVVQQYVEKQLHIIKQQQLKGLQIKRLSESSVNTEAEYQETMDYLNNL